MMLLLSPADMRAHPGSVITTTSLPLEEQLCSDADPYGQSSDTGWCVSLDSE